MSLKIANSFIFSAKAFGEVLNPTDLNHAIKDSKKTCSSIKFDG